MTNSEELDFDEILQKWESMSSEIIKFQNENNFLLQLLDKVAFYKAEAEYSKKRQAALVAEVAELRECLSSFTDVEGIPTTDLGDENPPPKEVKNEKDD